MQRQACAQKRSGAYWMEMMATSKISVAFGGLDNHTQATENQVKSEHAAQSGKEAQHRMCVP